MKINFILSITMPEHLSQEIESTENFVEHELVDEEAKLVLQARLNESRDNLLIIYLCVGIVLAVALFFII